MASENGFQDIFLISGEERLERVFNIKDSQVVKIPLGSDGITFESFEKNFDNYSKGIIKRLKTGKYIFKPFREVLVIKDQDRLEFPRKKDYLREMEKGNTRSLAICAIQDMIVQLIIYRLIYDIIEKEFEVFDKRKKNKIKPVSYAYRKKKSTMDAASSVLEYSKLGYTYVLEADLKKFFDTIPWKPLEHEISRYIDANSRVFKILHRFMHVNMIEFMSYKYDKRINFKTMNPYSKEANLKMLKRTAGVPQGGVLSGLLANLYMHRFDEWVVRVLKKDFDIQYVRYADDFVILARSEQDAEDAYYRVYEFINKLYAEGGMELKLYPLSESINSKTKITNLNLNYIKFVGFNINTKTILISHSNIKKFKNKWNRKMIDAHKHFGSFSDPRFRLRLTLQRVINFRVDGVSYYETCQKCGQTYLKRRNWIKYFCRISNMNQIKRLNNWIKKRLYHEFDDINNLNVEELKTLGFSSLVKAYYRGKFYMECDHQTQSIEVHEQNDSQLPF